MNQYKESYIQNVEMKRYTKKTLTEYFNFLIKPNFAPSQKSELKAVWNRFMDNLVSEEKIKQSAAEKLKEENYV